MRRLLAPVMALSLMTLIARADETPTSSPAQTALTELAKSFKDAQTKYVKETRESQASLKKALEEAKTDEEKKEIEKKLSKLGAPGDGPGPGGFALKFVAFAQQNAKDKASLEALNIALQISGGPFLKGGPWSKVLDEIRVNHAADPEVRVLLRPLAQETFDEASEKLLREVASKNPNRKVQAYALGALASSRETVIHAAERMQKNPEERAAFEKQLGKELIADLFATLPRSREAAAFANKTLRDQFSDIVPVVGAAPPVAVCKDLNDKEVRVKDLKGKVVVLDIWATWCPPCKAMIPHERAMVEKLKDKPFVLISISADAEKKTLTDFLETEKMPWTHWWNGQKGGVIEAWEVNHFPTIYVLDAKGIIRFKELRGQELEDAVEMLLKEAEAK